VTEDHLAYVFSSCGDVIDCRSCGDPNSALRFAFVEFAEEGAAKAALNLSGMLLDYSVVKVFPSKTPIIPVNPNFLPTSGPEQEMCERTVYVTHIDKKVSRGSAHPSQRHNVNGHTCRYISWGSYTEERHVCLVYEPVRPLSLHAVLGLRLGLRLGFGLGLGLG